MEEESLSCLFVLREQIFLGGTFLVAVTYSSRHLHFAGVVAVYLSLSVMH